MWHFLALSIFVGGRNNVAQVILSALHYLTLDGLGTRLALLWFVT